MDKVRHETTCTDEQVRLVNNNGYSSGTVARCLCGWRSSWWVRDGSAECDAHMHMRAKDPEYRDLDDERQRLWAIEREARERVAEAARLERLANTPLGPERKPPETHYHECYCHLDPPCSQCVNCVHIDYPECPNDCQTCEEPHEY